MIIFSFILSLFANHLPVMYVQVPQWADDWAVCAVDIPDAKCHWYVMAPDNTFGEGFDWESAPWFDANGLNDVAPMQASTVVEQLQRQQAAAAEDPFSSIRGLWAGCAACHGNEGQGMGMFPKLAGQSADYISGRLYQYQNGETVGNMSSTMWAQASMLSDGDIDTISKFIEETMK